MPIADLRNYESQNDLLHITDKERAIGVKYCFQTQQTRLDNQNTIRGPVDMFSTEESYIDNDCQNVLDRLTTYYGE